MIELFRHYWWVAVIIAALIVVVTHAGLVKLVAVLQENERQADAARQAAAGRAGEGGDPPAS